jgi:hypothetical protein
VVPRTHILIASDMSTIGADISDVAIGKAMRKAADAGL